MSGKLFKETNISFFETLTGEIIGLAIWTLENINPSYASINKYVLLSLIFEVPFDVSTAQVKWNN